MSAARRKAVIRKSFNSHFILHSGKVEEEYIFIVVMPTHFFIGMLHLRSKEFRIIHTSSKQNKNLKMKDPTGKCKEHYLLC